MIPNYIIYCCVIIQLEYKKILTVSNYCLWYWYIILSHNNNSESADNDLHGAAEKKREEDGPAGDLPRRPLDGMNQAEHLLAGESAPRTELIYNINDALRVTAAIRYTAQADSTEIFVEWQKYNKNFFYWSFLCTQLTKKQITPHPC